MSQDDESRRRFSRLTLAAVALAFAVSAGLWFASGGRASHNTNCTNDFEADTFPCGTNGIALDADTSVTGVQASRQADIGVTFQVGIVVTEANEGVAGMEVQIASTEADVLTVDTSNTATGLKPTSALTGVGHGCGPSGPVATGPFGGPDTTIITWQTHVTCTAAAGAPSLPLNATIFTLNVTCVGNGAATLRLVRGVNAATGSDTSDEDLIFGNAHLKDASNFIPLHLTDAQITCGALPTATPTTTLSPTHTPTATNTPTATSTPTPTSTPTSTATATPTVPAGPCPEDVNGDGSVTGEDVAAVGRSLHAAADSSRYAANADIDGDLRVTGSDLVAVVRRLVRGGCG